MTARPFIKWIGGKAAIAEQVLDRLGDLSDDDVYYEPFLGGGAVFLALRNRGFKGKAYLMDKNKDLINAWDIIQRPEPLGILIHLLKEHAKDHKKDPHKHYYAVRDRVWNVDYHEWEGPVFRAANFIYLNKTCFNGLYRVNKHGLFNASLGRTSDGKPPVICDEENLLAVHEALKEAKISHWCFSEGTPFSKEGGVREITHVYADPPYDGDYSKYTHPTFVKEWQELLAKRAHYWASMKMKVVVSNSDTRFIRSLYKKAAKKEVIQAPRRVNRDGKGRGKVGELLITL